MHLSFASIQVSSPINNLHDFEGLDENQHVVFDDKTWFFYLDSLVEKNGSRAPADFQIYSNVKIVDAAMCRV